MKCPICEQTFKDPLALFSIKKVDRCPNCQKKWEVRPENNPEFKRFVIEFIPDKPEPYEIVIYAKTREDAIDEFKEEYGNEQIERVTQK